MRKIAIVLTVVIATLALAGISVATGEHTTIKPMVLNHDEIEFRSTLPMPNSVPFPKEIHQEIDTTPALAYLLRPGVSTITSEDIGFEVTLTGDVLSMSEIGKPMVPYIIKKFKLPKDSDIESVSVNLSNPVEIHNIFIKPQPKPRMPGYLPSEYTIDNETYASHEPYPGEEYKYRLGGNPIHGKRVVFHIFPIQYIPSENKIIAYRKASISVSLTPLPTQPSALAPRPLGAGNEYECVIITHSDCIYACEKLADWKTLTGISTDIVYTGWIDETSIDGEYVPCDLYYADLCDWDTSGDGLYGAIGLDVDTDIIPRMKPELSIGKLPASTEAELNYKGGK